MNFTTVCGKNGKVLLNLDNVTFIEKSGKGLIIHFVGEFSGERSSSTGLLVTETFSEIEEDITEIEKTSKSVLIEEEQVV
jgi:anti-anti-sigma regulatory factor